MEGSAETEPPTPAYRPAHTPMQPWARKPAPTPPHTPEQPSAHTPAEDGDGVPPPLEAWLRRTSRVKRAALMAGVVAAYYVAARMGLRFAYVNPSATAIWPPTALALVAFLFCGRSLWPAVFTGAFLANAVTTGDPFSSFAIACGNTLEGVVGAWLVIRFARGARAMERAQDVFRYAAAAALVSPAISATIGVVSLALFGQARWADTGIIWRTWWLGDASANLILAPMVLAWMVNPYVRWTRRYVVEAIAIFSALVLVSMMVFGGVLPAPVDGYLQGYLCIPFIIWLAFRFGLRETATAMLTLSVISINGTLYGAGPFVRQTPAESLALLQVFMAVTAVMSLALAAVVAERRGVERQLRQLAVSDPHTGLANYRLLMEVMNREISRSIRTDRPFALLFADIDGLKKINDAHGHLAGTEAIRRVGDALRVTCRSIDTAARYGGDEFAVVLPEADERMARRFASRLDDVLQLTRTPFPVTVSVGTTEFPRDGRTPETLLAAADALLYQAKSRRAAALASRG